MQLVINNGDFKEVEDDEVDYELLSPANQFGTHINLIPVQSAVQVPRHFYGARFVNQAMPIKDAESPLVQNLDTSDELGMSFDQKLGKGAGAVFADDDGEVTHVSKNDINVRYKSGEERKHDIYDNMAFNRKSSITSLAKVKPGDVVKKGQLLAKSNYTDDNGELAMGLNARIGAVPYKGYSMDDAIVLSESFANRLQSEHMDTYMLEHDRDIKTGLGHFRSLFPETFKKAQFDKLDDNGVVTPGTILEKGDPIILSTRPRVLSSTGLSSGKMTKAMSQARSDASQVWDSEQPGEVIDVFHNKKNIKVITRSYVPTDYGDKVVMRSGAKAIVSCYDDKTEIFTDGGWKYFRDLSPTDKVASLCGDVGRFVKPDRHIVAPYEGPMFGHKNAQVDYLVTPNHKMWSRIESYRGITSKYKFRDAADIHGKKHIFLAAAKFETASSTPLHIDVLDLVDFVPLPGQRLKTKFKTVDFAELLGFVLSEGSTSFWEGSNVGKTNSKVKCYKFQIAQDWKSIEESKRISTLLDRMGLPYSRGKTGQFCISNKVLYTYFKTLGKCRDKFIPEMCFGWGQEALEALWVGLWWGDGSEIKLKNGLSSYAYCTTSSKLARDVERLTTILGFNSYIDPITRPDLSVCYYVRSKSGKESGQSTGEALQVNYSGLVYCVTVPGNIVLVRRNGCRPFWCGNCILPDDRMPHTEDGAPLDVLLNPLSLYSRSNLALPYEMLLGKVAQATGKKIRVPGFTKPGEKWKDVIFPQLEAAGLTDRERVFDPSENRYLDAPVMVGNAYMMKLHHLSSGKLSSRGQGSYDQWEQPTRGASESAKAKRLSGLESVAMLSSGAYANLREGSTLRGTKSDEYWRALRTGQITKKPGVPFAWDKAMQFMRGAGIDPKDVGNGKIRLGPMRDETLDSMRPVEIKSGGLLNLNNMSPVSGGLFDQALVGNNGWGKITLPMKVPNPAYEDAIRVMLGLKKSDMEEIMRGRMELPEHLR